MESSLAMESPSWTNDSTRSQSDEADRPILSLISSGSSATDVCLRTRSFVCHRRQKFLQMDLPALCRVYAFMSLPDVARKVLLTSGPASSPGLCPL
ncbi:hypothetical protein O9K51_10916 [Purpureocillium lavendulum]|uniref:Uncharacterized protein n=1 Tax=Purpureocillium lavendulum TaxID=1247861 RepID=A0AB34FCD9_9HYPO|nr:hypothetical protein O9K51_10916 [Purpureocillium lavendulum]